LRNSNKHLCIPGTVIDTDNHGKAVVLEYVDNRTVIIKFENTGHEQQTTPGQIKTGKIKDQSVPRGSVRVGDVFVSHNCGVCRVLEYRNSKDVLVRFDDTGVEKIFSASQLGAGTISDKSFRTLEIGDKFETNNFGVVTISALVPRNRVEVTFEDGATKECSKSSLFAGAVMNGSPRYTHEEAIDVLYALGTNYTFEKVVFSTVKGHITVTCKDHGDFQTTFDGMVNGGIGCRHCSIARRAKLKTLPFDEIMQEVVETHGTRYNYTKVVYKNLATKVEIICNDHGSFWQSLEKHKSGQHCPTCAGNATMTVERFMPLIPDKHIGLFQYHLITDEHFKDESRKLPIVCNKHGLFYQHYRNHLSGNGCRKCSRFGFNVNKAGSLYVLQDNQRVKVGITNRDIGIRLKEINKPNGNFNVVASHRFECGKQCADVETQALRYLSERYEVCKETFSGATESFENVDLVSVLGYIERIMKDDEKRAESPRAMQ
jgi:hypothetical protein